MLNPYTLKLHTRVVQVVSLLIPIHAAACLVLTAIMVLMAPRRGILPCSPNAISGVAALVSHSTELLEKLRDAGDADEK